MENRFEELMEQAESLPNGETKIAILEEAIRMADLHQDIEQGFYARMELTDVAVDVGRGEKAIVSFAWCLAQYDKNPGQYNDYSMMWHYKWIAGRIDQFPQVSLESIDQTLEDLKKRYTELGYSLRVYFQKKYRIAKRKGDTLSMLDYFEKWLDAPRDEMSDCLACEVDNQVGTLLDLGRFQEAYQKARPVLDQQLSCRSVPHGTFSMFLLPLLKEGRLEEAAEFHKQGYSMIRKEKGFLSSLSDHLKYLIIVDIPQAISLLERHLPEALASFEPNRKFDFFLAASILFDYVDERTKHVLQVPDYVTYEWLNQQVNEIAKKFDTRNQNHTYRDRIEKAKQEIQERKEQYEADLAKIQEKLSEQEENMKEIEDGIAQARQDADAGVPEAMIWLGISLLDGNGMEVDVQEGEKWLRTAIQAGSTDAMAILGNRFIDGEGLPQNKETGEKLLREAADLGNAYAMNELSARLIAGEDIEPNLPEGLDWLKKSAEKEFPAAMCRYGIFLLHGLNLDANPVQGEYWLRRAAEEYGYILAIALLGTSYLEGDILPHKPEEGELWLRKAAQEGYPPSMHQLGSRLLEGDGLATNLEEGEYWLRQAAENDYEPALHELGSRLLGGAQLKTNHLEGEVFLRRAASLGEVPAMFELSTRLLNEDQLPYDLQEGLKWLRQAADAEYPPAMYLYGCYLYDGIGVDADQEEAKQWLQRAAQLGVDQAQELLSKIEKGTLSNELDE